MLQTIRDRATGVIAWIIVILISVPFALWGINEYFAGDAKVYVAKVNDTDITLQEFQRAYQQQRQRLQNILGTDLNPDAINEAVLKREVLQGLIGNELLMQSAAEAGLRIGDQQLAVMIHSIEAFQKDGEFSSELYQQQLRNIGTVPEVFEAQQRRAMLTNQLYSGITDTAIVSAQELDRMIRIQDQQREVGYLLLPVPAFMKDVAVSDEDVNRYFTDNQHLFMHPEQVRVDYLELSAEAIASRVQPDEEELRRLYEESIGSFTVEEQRRASHILFQLPPDADEKATASVRAKAEKVLERVRSGESFEALAKEFSEDPASAQQGGDLDFFGRGMMVPAFEEAVFAMRKGEVSDLVKSPFGFHIIKLTDIKAGSKKSFEEVRPELVKQLRDREAEREYYEQAERLTNLTYENPDSLEPAAETLGLSVKESGWITRSGGKEGLGANPKVVAAAFSEDVLVHGRNSEPIEIGPTQVLVIRVKEHKPATARPLDEVRREIVAELRSRAARDKARELGEQIRIRAAAGADLAQLAAEHKMEVKRLGFIGRGDKAVDPAVLHTAFTLQRPVDGKPSYGTTSLNSGDYAVVAVTAVRDGDPSKVPEERKKSLAQTLTEMNGAVEFSSVMALMKSRARIIVNEDKL